MRSLPLVAAACALLPTPWLAVSMGQAAEPTEAEEMLDPVNEKRSMPTVCGAEGEMAAAEPLELDERLSDAARLHAVDMRGQGEVDHVGSDGSTITDRIERQGHDWSAAGENVAHGYEMGR